MASVMADRSAVEVGRFLTYLANERHVGTQCDPESGIIGYSILCAAMYWLDSPWMDGFERSKNPKCLLVVFP